MPERYDLLRDGYTAVTLLVAEDLEFRVTRRRGGDVHVLRTGPGSMEKLIAALESDVAPESVADPEGRLVSALTDWLASETATAADHLILIVQWLHDRAGVSYERSRLDGTGAETAVKRTEVLSRSAGPAGGPLRTYLVEFEPDSPWPIRFAETYRMPGEITGYSHEVTISRPVSATLDVRDDPSKADALIAAIEARVDRDDLLPGEARDRVAALLDETDVGYSRTGRIREVQLPAVGLDLKLTIQSGDGRVQLAVSKESEPGTFYLDTDRASIPALVEFLESRVPPSAGVLDDRLAAGFVALAGAGQLAGTPMSVRDRLAGWYREAGVPYTSRAFGRGRGVELLSVHRDRTNCIFTLKVFLDPDDERKGIGLSEKYDYLPTKADAGREYAYAAYAPYSSLERLVAHLEAGAPRDGDLEQRLIACFTARIDSGELGDHLPIKSNRERAAKWFGDAGVPVEEEFWSWHNSD